ncbi:MAG TPA: hypothetical protein VKK79_05960 [Candidatus Lokiarchaeia archaeon]|nr:hypothetical protein [Candidatus Lokiarchaeia archaeon]
MSDDLDSLKRMLDETSDDSAEGTIVGLPEDYIARSVKYQNQIENLKSFTNAFDKKGKYSLKDKVEMLYELLTGLYSSMITQMDQEDEFVRLKARVEELEKRSGRQITGAPLSPEESAEIEEEPTPAEIKVAPKSTKVKVAPIPIQKPAPPKLPPKLTPPPPLLKPPAAVAPPSKPPEQPAVPAEAKPGFDDLKSELTRELERLRKIMHGA